MWRKTEDEGEYVNGGDEQIIGDDRDKLFKRLEEVHGGREAPLKKSACTWQYILLLMPVIVV